jgi:hypothetical protein
MNVYRMKVLVLFPDSRVYRYEFTECAPNEYAAKRAAIRSYGAPWGYCNWIKIESVKLVSPLHQLAEAAE